MSGDEVLIGIAQIAGTFAGFAALAGLIGANARGTAAYDTERLRAVVLNSLMVVVAALIPIVVERCGLSEATMWRVSSALALLINWALGATVITFGRRSGLLKADRTYKWAGYLVEFPLQLALIVNVFNLLPANAAGLYLAFLYLGLIQAVLVLIQLMNSLFVRADDQAP